MTRRDRRLRAALPLLLAACSDAGSAPPPPAALTQTVRTAHFVLHTDLDAVGSDFHARLFEAFRTWFAARYFTPDPKAPLSVYVFATEAEFTAFGRQIGGPDAAGYFKVLGNGTPVLVVNLDTGLGTTLHELVHAFVYQGFRPWPPLWFNEGFAAYHEKCLGQLDGSVLQASFGYFSNWRFPRLKAEAVAGRLRLANLLDPTQDPSSAAGALMLFLDRRGRFVPLVRAMREAHDDPDGMRTLAAVWGGDLATLEAEWLTWLRDQPIDAEVLLVPRTTILPPAEWAAWLQAQTGLQWDAAVGRYTPRRR